MDSQRQSVDQQQEGLMARWGASLADWSERCLCRDRRSYRRGWSLDARAHADANRH